jgi:arsenate reductase-like glutaredoxin family protein
MIRIVFPEYKNEIIASAIEEAKLKYDEFEPILAESLEEACEILASDGMLIKRPLLIKENKIVQIGYRTEYSATLFQHDKSTISRHI